jgi:hypothetical protein
MHLTEYGIKWKLLVMLSSIESIKFITTVK